MSTVPEKMQYSIPSTQGLDLASLLPEPAKSAEVDTTLANTVRLRHPPLARMLSQAWDLPRRGSLCLGYLVLDVAFSIANVFLVSNALGVWAHTGFAEWRRPVLSQELLAYLGLYSILTVLACRNYGLYETRAPRPLLQRGLSLTKAMTLSTGSLALFVGLAGIKVFTPLTVVWAGALNMATFAGWRLWNRRVARRGVITRKHARHLLIVGGGQLSHTLADSLQKNPYLGYAVTGFLDDGPQLWENGNGHKELKFLGCIKDLSHVARAHFVDEILIVPPFKKELVQRVLREARYNRLDVKIVPEIYEQYAGPSLVDYIGTIPILSLHHEPIPADFLIIKRIFDITLSSILLLASTPLLLAIAIAIKLDSSGPILYCSPRIGKKGTRFCFYKFRTMVVNAHVLKEQLRKQNECSGPFFKITNDPRITRVGRLLRKFSLDELPQLWNVLKGDMSLVGPRPHPVDDCINYELEHLRRLDVMPGVTGLWQISARRDRSFETNMALDLEYIESWSLWQDLKILLKTVPAVMRAEGE